MGKTSGPRLSNSRKDASLRLLGSVVFWKTKLGCQCFSMNPQKSVLLSESVKHESLNCTTLDDHQSYLAGEAFIDKTDTLYQCISGGLTFSDDVG
jgi:hypothetical protein